MMNKTYVAMMFCMLVLSVLYAAEGVSAEMQKPEWQKGDYWEYNLESLSGAEGTPKWEIQGEETITVNGTEYNVLTVTWNESHYNESYPAGPVKTNAIIYYILSDYSMIKAIINGSNDVQFSHLVTIFNPPHDSYDWPLNVGETWSSSQNTITNWSITLLPSGNISYYNYTDSSDRYYECEDKTDVSTPAGVFNCYVVRSWTGEEKDIDNSILDYFSPSVGYYVKQISYMDGEVYSLYNLTSYKYLASDSSGGATDKGKGVPGFELLFAVCAIALVLFWKRKR